MNKSILLISAVCIGMAATAVTAVPYWRPAKGTVALTFDDGPNAKDTPQILDVLKREHVQATFFVLGSFAKKHPKLLRRMQREGHAVSSHSMWHPNLKKLSERKLKYQVVASRDIISRILGKKIRCLRPPFGETNRRVERMINSAGLKQVPIGYNTFDYTRPGYRKIVSNTMKGLRQGRRIFLLHDGPKRRDQTIQALPIIIAKIRKKGLGFSSICKQH